MSIRPILVVEDNPMDLDLMFQALQEHSVANPIAACRDGEEALHYIQAHRLADDPAVPILVLLDLRLPKVDGIEVLRQARSDSVWSQVPFVVMTTSRENTDIEAAYRLGEGLRARHEPRPGELIARPAVERGGVTPLLEQQDLLERAVRLARELEVHEAFVLPHLRELLAEEILEPACVVLGDARGEHPDDHDVKDRDNGSQTAVSDR